MAARLSGKQVEAALALLGLTSGEIGFFGVGNTVCAGVFFSRIQASFSLTRNALDIQKAGAARQDMYVFMGRNRPYLSFEDIIPHFYCFHQNDKEAILRSFKKSTHPDDAIRTMNFAIWWSWTTTVSTELRKPMTEGNLSYLIRGLLKVQEVKEKYRAGTQHWLVKCFIP